MTLDRRRDWWIVAAATAVAAVLRLANIGQFSFWIDEIITLCSADAIHDLGTLWTPTCGNLHPPLMFLLLKGWAVFGRSDAWLRIMPALFGVAAVPFVYLLGREMAGRDAGRMAAILAATSPFLVQLDRELRMYALFSLLSTVSLLYFLRALRDQKRSDWIVFTVASVLNVYVHYHAVLLLAGQAVVAAFWLRRQRSWRPPLAAAVTIAVAFAFWLPALWYQFSNPVAFSLNTSDKFPITSDFGVLRLGYTFFAFAIGQTLLPWRPLAIAGVVAIAVCVLSGLWRSRHDRDRLVVIAGAGLVPILLGFAVSSSMPRYYVFVAPLFLIVCALGVLAVRPRALQVLVSATLVIVLGQGLFNYYRGREFHIMAPADPWREATAYLLQRAQSGDCLLALGSSLNLDYYSGLTPFVRQPMPGDAPTALECLDRHPNSRLWVVTSDAGAAAQSQTAVSALDAVLKRIATERFLHDPDHAVKARWFRKSFLEYRILIYGYERQP